MFKPMMLLASLVLAASLTGCATKTGPTMTPATPVAIQNHITGDQSGITQPTVKVINSTSELEALNSPALNAAGVDFANNSLIVLALGEQTSGGYWAKITAVERLGDVVTVYGAANAPAGDAMNTAVMTTPFDAVVVPALGAVDLQTHIKSLQGKDAGDVEACMMNHEGKPGDEACMAGDKEEEHDADDADDAKEHKHEMKDKDAE